MKREKNNAINSTDLKKIVKAYEENKNPEELEKEIYKISGKRKAKDKGWNSYYNY